MVLETVTNWWHSLIRVSDASDIVNVVERCDNFIGDGVNGFGVEEVKYAEAEFFWGKGHGWKSFFLIVRRFFWGNIEEIEKIEDSILTMGLAGMWI